jgi:hypothetical protein
MQSLLWKGDTRISNQPEDFTTEAQRARRQGFMSVPGMPAKSISPVTALPSVPELRKAILFFLGVLSASAVKLKRLG